MIHKKTLSELRVRLESERDRLRHEIEDFERAGAQSLPEASGENVYRDHIADQGSALFSRELDLTLEENLRQMLGQVERALDRMDEGEYGKCRNCAGDIDEERLEAFPAAELCIRCKQREETR